MAQHIDTVTVTRDGLLHRYANTMGMTYGQAVDMNADRTLEQLREAVEAYEQAELDTRPVHARGRRRSFARSQPTTSLRGQVR